jgi:RHS repeat-associated protein
VRLSLRARMSSGFVLVPALALGVALLPGGAAQAAPARSVSRASAATIARPAAPARPVLLTRTQGADGPAVAQKPAGTVASPPSIPVGTGPVKNGTFRSFAISDKVSLGVNVGSGNALLTTSDVTVPEIGSSLTLGTSYNSLLVGSGVAQGAEGYGWRQREGVDVQLYPASSDNSVTLLGEDGTAGKFTAPQSGSHTYGSPSEFQATLTNSPDSSCSGSSYELTWHQTGEVMCFNSSGLITSEVDRNGNTTSYSYCGCGHESTITYTPKGASSPTRTVSASYTGSYLTGLSESGGSAGTKNITYNVNSSTGDLSSLTQADGSLISFGYDSSHDLTSIKDYANNTTTLGYNSAHQVTSVIQTTTGSTTATTRFSYVSSTQTQVADPNTNQTQSVSSVPHETYTIDSSTSLVNTTVDQGNNTRSAHYNSADNLTTASGAINGENTTNGYTSPNGAESLTSSKSPTGATATWTYTNTGTYPGAAYLPSGSKDAQNNASAYTYDGAGNLQQAQNALPATAKVHYNSDGTPQYSTPPVGTQDQTNYAYTDGNHELNTITPPSGGSLLPTTITYDGFGRVATVSDSVNTVTYTYDLADRITKAAYTGGPKQVTVTYTYDGAGNMKTQADASGTVTWIYDGRNLVLTRTSTASGGTLSYGYDLDGNLTTAQDANGTTTYYYNNLNQLYQLKDPIGYLWEFAYDADGRRTKTWFDTNTGETTWAAKMVTSYDLSGRISQIVAYENTSYSDQAFNMTYCHTLTVSGKACSGADTSLVQSATNNITGVVSEYTYDNGNRLKTATNVSGKNFSYGYDGNGNLTSGAVAGSLSYNADNQISSSGYHYDGAGNMTADNRNGTLTYNDAGQLVAASNADGVGTENFTYAGTGQSQLLSDGTATGITYGLPAQGGQPWVQSYTGAISPTPIYVLHDQQGTPLGMEHNGNAYFFVTDNLGSVVDLIDHTGGAAATYNWDPYGHLISQSGGEENYNLIRFTGGLADMAYAQSQDIPGTDNTHLGDRWQDPHVGTFIQPDPVTQLSDPANANAYPYAADSPTNYIDTTGRSVCTWLVGGLFGLIGIGVTIAAPPLGAAIFFGVFLTGGGILAADNVC